MSKAKTQVEKIENVLRKYNMGPGVTPESVAKRARVPLKNVYKRVSDLREHYVIYTNYRKVGGKRTAFYRMSDSYAI
jgi:hypothetical protein